MNHDSALPDHQRRHSDVIPEGWKLTRRDRITEYTGPNGEKANKVTGTRSRRPWATRHRAFPFQVAYHYTLREAADYIEGAGTPPCVDSQSSHAD